MRTINDRLREILNTMFNGNVSEFARKSTIPQPTLNNIVGNRESKPSSDNLERLVNSIELINPEWLLTGKGNMLKDESPVFSDESEFISYLKSQIEELKQDNEDLKLRNERLAEQNGYYKGLLDNNSISYKQTAS